MRGDSQTIQRECVILTDSERGRTITSSVDRRPHIEADYDEAENGMDPHSDDCHAIHFRSLCEDR